MSSDASQGMIGFASLDGDVVLTRLRRVGRLEGN